MNSSKDGERIGLLLGWVIVLLGWVFASLVANGGEIPRLALILPFSVLGTLLCVVFGKCPKNGWGIGIVSLVAGYFLTRAYLSPVWDFGRRDIFLVTTGSLSFLSGAAALHSKGCRRIFLGFLVAILLGHIAVSVVQLIEGGRFSFFRRGRTDVVGVSGFYFHRNYLAGFLELLLPVLVAILAGRRKPKLTTFWAGIALVSVALCFLSNSRGGFGAMMAGGAVAFLMQRRVDADCNGGSPRRLVRGMLVTATLVVTLLVGFQLWQMIFSTRGGASEGLEGRLAMAGIAMDGWLRSPVFGNGSHSYSYLFPQEFVGIGGWFGNAEMAHCDYLQILCDYGVVGLGGVVLLILFFGANSIGNRPVEPDGNWLNSAGGGMLAAEALRAVFDFNLHIAPNLMLLGFVLGGVLSLGQRAVIETRLSLISRFSKIALALAFSAFSLGCSWREIVAAREWFHMELTLQNSNSIAEKERALRSYSEVAPSFIPLRKVARISLMSSSREGGRELALRDWKAVVERHPLDGESLANYARCLDDSGLFGKSEVFHLQALKAVGARENKYGVISGVGWHLAKRAQDRFYSRNSGEALFLFHRAREAFVMSFARKYGRQSATKDAIDWVDSQIVFLESARIEPVEVEILDWRSKLP